MTAVGDYNCTLQAGSGNTTASSNSTGRRLLERAPSQGLEHNPEYPARRLRQVPGSGEQYSCKKLGAGGCTLSIQSAGSIPDTVQQQCCLLGDEGLPCFPAYVSVCMCCFIPSATYTAGVQEVRCVLQADSCAGSSAAQGESGRSSADTLSLCPCCLLPHSPACCWSGSNFRLPQPLNGRVLRVWLDSSSSSSKKPGGYLPEDAASAASAGAVAGIVVGTTLGAGLTALIGWVAYREYQKRRLKRYYK